MAMAEKELEQEQSLENRNSRSWKDLPVSVLSEFYTRIYAVDQSSFRLVSKSWNRVHSLTTRSLHLPSKNSKCQTPCLLFKNNNLYHPIYDTHHMIDIQPDGIVIMAKDDWFLMTRNSKEVFFYHTITKAKVKLPNLIHSIGLKSMCFSTPPTSKGWQVIAAVYHAVETETPHRYNWQIVVDSIKDGEKDWSSCWFIPMTGWEHSFYFTHCNAVLHKGLYYFLGLRGMVLIHDPNKRKFVVHKANKYIPEDLKVKGGNQYMLECDEKLMVVLVNSDRSVIKTYGWDASKKEWKIVESLWNKMLFVSDISSMSEKAVIKGTGNKIYFPSFMDGHGLFYCFSSKRYHTFEGGSYGDFNVRGLKHFFNSTWIKVANSM